MRVILVLALAAAVAADKPGDAGRLQGLWQAVSLEVGGRKAPDADVKAFKVLVAGDTLAFNPDAENRTHTFALDEAADPKAMDLTPHDGPLKGRRRPAAIYKVDGDELTICVEKEGPGTVRPKEFKTAAGAHRTALLVLRRVKEPK